MTYRLTEEAPFSLRRSSEGRILEDPKISVKDIVFTKSRVREEQAILAVSSRFLEFLVLNKHVAEVEQDEAARNTNDTKTLY